MIESEAPSRASRARTAAVVLAIGAAIVLAGALIVGSLVGSGGGASPPAMDAARATSIALDFYAGAHTRGATVGNVKVLTVAFGPDEHGRPVWKVEISGEVTEPGQTFAYASAMWLYVDPYSGEVRVFAQG
jgi:hypothetical protein